MWLEDGFLQRLGPDTGTFTSNAGNLSKPDSVLTNRQMYHFYHVSRLDRNVSDHAPMSLEISYKPIKIPAPLHEIYKKKPTGLSSQVPLKHQFPPSTTIMSPLT